MPRVSGVWTRTLATTQMRARRGMAHVELLITEVLGGVHSSACKMLRRLERHTKRGGARDGTIYGRSLTAAKGFTSHWLRMISASIACLLHWHLHHPVG